MINKGNLDFTRIFSSYCPGLTNNVTAAMYKFNMVIAHILRKAIKIQQHLMQCISQLLSDHKSIGSRVQVSQLKQI